MHETSYTTPHGIKVTRSVSKASYRRGLKHLLRDLDRHRGIYLSSGYEYPGRYSRWDIASTCPPLEIVSYDRQVEFRPLNRRGRIICEIAGAGAGRPSALGGIRARPRARLRGRLKPLPKLFPEEERSKQPSAFSILRALIEEFRGEEDSRLGLVGAFGYDLLFQFEPIEKKLPRSGHKDLHLFLCDDIWFMDRKKEQIERYRYDFARDERVHRGPAARWRRRSLRPRRARPGRSSPTTRPKSTWPTWRRCARACAAAITTKWCCGRPSARRIRARPPSCSNGCSAPAPAPTSFCCNSARSNWWGRRPRCSCGWKGIASRPVPFRARRSAPAIRCATRRTSASC